MFMTITGNAAHVTVTSAQGLAALDASMNASTPAARANALPAFRAHRNGRHVGARFYFATICLTCATTTGR